MNSLLAILLVINSTRGHHYVFSYPPDPQRPSKIVISADKYNVANSTNKAYTSQERLPPNAAGANHNNSADAVRSNTSTDNSTTSTTNNNTNNSNNSNNNNNSSSGSNSSSNAKNGINNTKEDELIQQHDSVDPTQGDGGRDTIFDIDVSLLADTLSPKPALCDRKFQLSLDDLTFVGHPVSLTTPNAATEYNQSHHYHSYNHNQHHHRHQHQHQHQHHRQGMHHSHHPTHRSSKSINDTQDHLSSNVISSALVPVQSPVSNRINLNFPQQNSLGIQSSTSPIITSSSAVPSTASSSPSTQGKHLDIQPPCSITEVNSHTSSTSNTPNNSSINNTPSPLSTSSSSESSSSSSGSTSTNANGSSISDSNDHSCPTSNNSSESDNNDHQDHGALSKSNSATNSNNTSSINTTTNPGDDSVSNDLRNGTNSTSSTNDDSTNNSGGPTRPGHGKRKKSNRGGDGTKFDRSTTMTQFHVVFVLSPADLEVNAQVNAIYKHVVMRYTAALRYEQLRCRYVQDEVEKVLAIRDGDDSANMDYSVVMQTILQQSSLARDIRHIYTALTTRTTAHVIINDFIDVSLQIPLFTHHSRRSTFGAAMTQHSQRHQHQQQKNGTTQADDQKKRYQQQQQRQQQQQQRQQQKKNGEVVITPTTNTSGPLLGYESQSASLMDIYGMSGYEYDHYPVLCPYHTLLLLEDPEEVLKNMPLDASPTLVQLIQILTPTQTLQELHLILDCSLAQIYRLAAHLIYWRKAKLIHPIHARNNYVLSPKAKFKDLALIEQDFKLHVPSLNLPTFLSQLSYGKPLYRITPSKEYRNLYLEAITYLVRKDWIIQLHMFLVLMEPWPSDEEGGKWAHEKAPKEVADLLVRLVPYMDGKHPIEEIMYREAVSRKQLGLVLKYYRQFIVTMYH